MPACYTFHYTICRKYPHNTVSRYVSSFEWYIWETRVMHPYPVFIYINTIYMNMHVFLSKKLITASTPDFEA